MDKHFLSSKYDSDTDDSGEFLFHNPFLLEDDKFEKEFEKTLALFDALLIGEDSMNDTFSINSPPNLASRYDIRNSPARSNSQSVDRLIDTLPEQEFVELSNSFIKTSEEKEDDDDEERPKSFLHDEVNEFNRLLRELSETPLTSKYSTLGTRSSPKVRNSLHSHASATSLPLQSHLGRRDSDKQDANLPSDRVHSCDKAIQKLDGKSSLCNNEINREESSASGCKLTDKSFHLCHDCIPTKQKACREIIESGFFESLRPYQSIVAEGWGSRSIERGGRGGGGGCNGRMDFRCFSDPGLDQFAAGGFPGFACKKDESDSAYQTGNSDTLTSSSKSLALVADALNIIEDYSERSLARLNLEEKFAHFNKNKSGLSVELAGTNTNIYRGTLRVYMNLTQPISIRLAPSDPRPTPHDKCRHSAKDLQILQYDSILRKKSPQQNLVESKSPKNKLASSPGLPHSLPELSKCASFYLPIGVSKVVHVLSTLTTPDVIKILLDKFHIINSVQKFALFQKTFDVPVRDCNDGELSRPLTCHMRKLGDEERPLEILLKLVEEADLGILNRIQFVLQEYSSGEIIWDAFSIPELNNFLVILDREEDIKIAEVEQRYAEVRKIFKKRMEELSSDRETMC